MWDRKIKDETVNELTRAVMTTVLFVAGSFQQGRALLLPQCVTVFLGSYPPAKDNDDLYLELGDGIIKFSFQMVTAPTNYIYSALYELQMCYEQDWHTSLCT